MERKRKQFNPVLLFFGVYVFGLAIYSVGRACANWTYTYLNFLFPDIFPVYNQIHEASKYAALETGKDVVGIFLSLVLINLIALRLDNKKYERIALLTEGQYLMKDGIKLYFKEFFVSDLLVSTLTPAILVIPAYLFSENSLGYFGLIIWNWLGYNMRPLVSLFPAMLIVAAFSFVGRMIAIPHCVKAWRSAWLTDI